MTLEERIFTLLQLGEYLRAGEDEFLAALQQRTEFNNAWFTLANQQAALTAIAEEFLQEAPLRAWLQNYSFAPAAAPNAERSDLGKPKNIGLILAGNIPLVGFHDLLCVYLAGHRSLIKLSSKDPYVLPYLLKLLGQFDDGASDYFQVVEKLTGFDAVIATGSNNSARYFEAYFGKVPNIIRRNRNAVAVLSGQETAADLRALGDDVFRYFGLGCRNVAKLYAPKSYDFQPLLEIFHEWKELQNHTKWKNNFDYNFALTTLNKESFHLTGPLMLLESEVITSRIATLHFERYTDLPELELELERRKEEIQLIVAQPGLLKQPSFPFGKAQQPGLADYADGVDTMKFLAEL